MQPYDSLNPLKNNQDLVSTGPTGCGKTEPALTTGYLVHAMNREHPQNESSVALNNGRVLLFRYWPDLPI